MAQLPVVQDNFCNNDVIGQFNADFTFAFGKVSVEDDQSEVQWDETREHEKEPIASALERGRVFMVNRQVFLGSVVAVQGQRGIVSTVEHRVIGLVKKVVQGKGGKNTEKEVYVLSEIPVPELTKIIPYKVGDHILYKNWVGYVTSVSVNTTWTLDNGKSQTITLPLAALQAQKLTLGKQVENLAETLKEYGYVQPSSWLRLPGRSKGSSGVFSELKPAFIEVCWLDCDGQKNGNGPTEPPTKLEKAEDLTEVKTFNFYKDDVAYFGSGEHFKISWVDGYKDHLQTFESWQKLTLLKSTDVFKDHTGTDAKKAKENPVFKSGEVLIVTPLAIETRASVVLLNNNITHNMKTREIENVLPSVMPRPDFEDPLHVVVKYDMVRDRLSYDEKYGFVESFGGEEDNMVSVKWIKDLGDKNYEESKRGESIYDLVQYDRQPEFNVTGQSKIVSARDGVKGTLTGISFPNCKVILREAGSFKEHMYWPHEIGFLNKQADATKGPKESPVWQVKDVVPNYPHSSPWHGRLFARSPSSVTIKQIPVDEGVKLVYYHELSSCGLHSFAGKPLVLPSPNQSVMLNDCIEALDAAALKDVLMIERNSKRPDLATVYISGSKDTGLDGILFLVDVYLPKYGGDVHEDGVNICFRSVGYYKPNWPTSKVDRHGHFKDGKIACPAEMNWFAQLLSLIRNTIQTMDPIQKRVEASINGANCTKDLTANWEVAHVSLTDYVIASLYNCPVTENSAKELFGNHYFNHLQKIALNNLEYSKKQDDFNSSPGFQRAMERRVELTAKFLNATPSNNVFLKVTE